MPAPFSYRTFFRDPFFTRAMYGSSGLATVTHNGTVASLPCIYRFGLDPERDGALMQQGGHWADAMVLVEDWRAAFGPGTAPNTHDSIDLDGESFEVIQSRMQADAFNIKAVARQRAVGRR